LQNGGGISAGIYFSTDKPVDRVHASVDRPGTLGPPWTDNGADRGGTGRGGVLTGARPLAAPVHQSSPAGAQKGERSTGSSGGGVTTGRRRWHDEVTGNSVGRVSGVGEERRRAR
jgi:hypothetical protein